MLLLSNLCREIADELTPSRKQNREDGVKRLKLEKRKKEEQDAELARDPKYIRGLVLAGAKYLFAEFCGLVLFRSLGPSLHDAGSKLLATPSMKALFTEKDFAVITKAIKTEEYDTSDLFAVLWAIYTNCLENIIEMPNWRQQFEQAAVRSRFNYSDFNRKALFQQLESLDKVYQKRAYPQPWSEGIEKHKGIFRYVSAVSA
jgi:hypothetical protein